MDEKQIQRLRDVAFLLSSPGADYTLIPEAIQGLRELCDEVDRLRADATLGAMVRQLPQRSHLDHEWPTEWWSVYNSDARALYTGKTVDEAVAKAHQALVTKAAQS